MWVMGGFECGLLGFWFRVGWVLVGSHLLGEVFVGFHYGLLLLIGFIGGDGCCGGGTNLMR